MPDPNRAFAVYSTTRCQIPYSDCLLADATRGTPGALDDGRSIWNTNTGGPNFFAGSLSQVWRVPAGPAAAGWETT